MSGRIQHVPELVAGHQIRCRYQPQFSQDLFQSSQGESAQACSLDFLVCFAPKTSLENNYHEGMSVFDDRKDALAEHEFRMGLERGRLAVTLDLLTDALVLVGQHGVYCQSARQPGKPAMDVQLIDKCITDAKELVSSVMGELKRKS
jgi:hypothetical protein